MEVKTKTQEMSHTPVKHAVNGLWSETARLQEQIQKNYATTTQLLARANKLKERIVRQRQENQHALEMIDASPTRPTPVPAPSVGGEGGERAVREEAVGAVRVAEEVGAGEEAVGDENAGGEKNENGAVEKGEEGEGEGALDESISLDEFADAQAVYEAALEKRDEMIRRLESDNGALQETLKEYEAALEEIMEMHRSQLAIVQEKRGEEVGELTGRLGRAEEERDALAEKNAQLEAQIDQMAAVMRQAADLDEATDLESSLRQDSLERENAQLRELLKAYDEAYELDDSVVEELI